MIIRIVKMTFREEEIENFLNLFQQVKHKIRNFEGCQNLELLQDVQSANCLFTYSYWESEEHLNSYRNSKLFEETWKLTKSKFKTKAEAWSVEQIVSDINNILN